MLKSEAAAYLAGVTQTEGAEASAPTNLHVITGEVGEMSEDGKALVKIDGLMFSESDDQYIEIDALGGLEEGDIATLILTGEQGHAMTPLALGSIGSIDRITVRISEIEADYIKVEQLEAATARIGELEADHVSVDDLDAAEARIGTLETTRATITDLEAAEARIGTLESDHVSTDDLDAATARIGTLETNTADIGTIRANSAKVQNLTAAQLEADHATVGSLSTNYAHITNGVIDNATIGYADVNNLSAHYAEIQNGKIDSALINTAAIVDEQVFTVTGNKATLAQIDASKINVLNLKAKDIEVERINGQPVTNKTLVDALTQHESDISDLDSKIDDEVEALNERIDGAIETFTGTVVPTLNNTPASQWNTDALKDQHVGDVYYVVNGQSAQNGYCYRFTKSGSTYSWQLIKDSDVTAALSRLQTAEGKIGDIETFDETVSSFMTDTDDELSSLKAKDTQLETSLGDKVSTSTFNTVSQKVNSNEANITSMSTVLTNNGLTSSTNITNTVNSVKQTADTNTSSISTLQSTVSGHTTTISQHTTAIRQNSDAIALRATKTEASQMAQPNLTPYFSMPMTQQSDDYWANLTYARFTQHEDGWAHFEYTNTGSSTVNSYIGPKAISTLLPGGNYTLLAEFRNVAISGATNGSFYSQQISNAQIWGIEAYGGFSITNAQLIALENGEGKFYKSLTLLDAESKDPSGTVRGTLPKTIFMTINQQVAGGQSVSYDLRISLYEGEYTGPYKPYSGTQLYASQAELKVQADRIGMVVSNSDASSSLALTADAMEYIGDHVEIKGTDGTSTVISGGKIQANSIGASEINATSINASKSLTVGAMTDAAASTILNSNVQVGGRNLLRGTAAPSIVSLLNYEGWVVTSGGNGVGSIETVTDSPVPSVSSVFRVTGNTKGNRDFAQKNKTLEFDFTGPYRFSAWVRGVGGSANALIRSWNSTTGKAAFTKTINGVGTDWTRIEFDFEPSGNSPALGDLLDARFGITGAGTIEYVAPKLERGTRATDWTPAPEDMATAESLAGTNESLEGAIVDIGELSDQLVGTITEQNKTITTIQTYLNSLRQDLDAEIQSRQQWLNFDAAEGLVIGAKNSTFKTVTTNTSQQFKNGGTVLAETSGSEFVAPIMRSDQILIGNWMWTRRDNGNLSLKWIG